MSQMTLFEGILKNLKQEIEPGRREYLSREQAYQQLKYHTGEDFGYDAERWKAWIDEHPTSIRTVKR